MAIKSPKHEVLVADIGGSNARFAMATIGEQSVTVGEMNSFRVSEHKSVADAANAFLQIEQSAPKIACFAVAAHVIGKIVEFTNSPWTFDTPMLRKQLNLTRLLIINDFEALAASVRHLSRSDLVEVKPGKGDKNAPVLVMGPGTGLGQALIVPDGDHERIIATQGGHVGFAPRGAEEIEVLRVLSRDFDRVSIERLLSGGGLVNLHRALCMIAGAPQASRPAGEIASAALNKECPHAVKTVEMFCAILGSAVGDAVLATGARGGVVLGGGILTKIETIFRASKFLDRVLDKGRMRAYVDVPIDLIVRDGAALVGAAARLRERA